MVSQSIDPTEKTAQLPYSLSHTHTWIAGLPASSPPGFLAALQSLKIARSSDSFISSREGGLTMSGKQMSGMKGWINKSFRLDFTTFAVGEPIWRAALSYHSYLGKIDRILNHWVLCIFPYLYIYVYLIPQGSCAVRKNLEVSFRTSAAVFLLQTDVCSGSALWQLQTQEMCFESGSLSHGKHTVSSVSNNTTKCIHGACAWYSSNAITATSTFHVMFRMPRDKSQIYARVCNSHDEMESYQWPNKSGFILCKGGPTYGGGHFVITWSA